MATRQKSKTTTATETKEATVRKTASEMLREEIKIYLGQIDTGYIEAAKRLNEVYHKDVFKEWGFEKFQDYCSAELDIHYRKAMYLVDIIDTIKKYDLDIKEVESLGWSKMKEIASVINEKNAGQWMKKAKGMSAREVQEAVKMTRRKDSGQTDVPSITTMSLKMSEAEAGIILDAIDHCKKILENDNTVVALGAICQDWMEAQAATPNRATLDDHIAFLEKQFGVAIEYGKDKKTEKKKAAAKKKAVVDEGKARATKKVNGEVESDDIDDLLSDLGEGPDIKADEDDSDDINAALGL